ncbi:MAG TPA: hypothetical protein VGM90_41240 [Kofleriaceae bacterium]|jgi:cytochrome c peroxidase
MKHRWVLCALTACAADDAALQPVPEPTGELESVFVGATDDPSNPFFQQLGTNQRTCGTCHDRDAAWSVTPAMLQTRFDATDGNDPIFRPVDGADSPTADVASATSRRTAYSVMLQRGLIRVGMKLPANAEFELTAVTDPNGFASAAELSLFRRPLPSTNLRFAAQIMWDGRETTLAQQAMDATLGHAQAMQIDSATAMDQIVTFESAVYTAKRYDDTAGDLASDGALGGAVVLAAQEFHLGINDASAFNRDVFSLYGAWIGADTSTAEGSKRASIARGERLFNTKTFRIRNIGGLPDQQGTCSTCHDTPNVGNRSVATPLDIGVSDQDQRPGDLPLYTLRNIATGATVSTSDPGYAMVTGKWGDIGKFKVPSLRGVASRPPYFHNGIAADFDAVLRFYDRKLGFDLSGQESTDLKAFLSAL